MTKPAAFRAAYADWRLIKTRQVVQVCFEIPISDADLAYQALGGMPDPAAERWFGIARLTATKEAENVPATQDVPASRPRKPVSPEKRLAQQAGIACSDPVFWKFMEEAWEDGEAWTEGTFDHYETPQDRAAAIVRAWCRVKSRSEIIPGTQPGIEWDRLHGAFMAWRLT